MSLLTKIVGNLVIIAIVVLMALVVLGTGSWLPLVLAGVLYGWGWFTFFQYRYIQQEEVLHLLGTAADAGSPLGPALWAYLGDRPRRSRFDARLEEMARHLDSGWSLAEALRATPGVVARETELAAAVGESTGRLAICLRNAPRWRLATTWLEAAPRLLYPVILLLLINAIFGFLMVFIAPKFEKIVLDMHVRLPESTRQMFGFGRSFFSQGGAFGLLFFGLSVLTVLLIVIPTARWYCPGLGAISRMHVQSRLLSMLGILLDAQQPLPQALAVLADSGYFVGVAHRQLLGLNRSIERGEPLAPTMHRHGLLPARMVALVQAAERAHNLPWALAELGGHLARRAQRVVLRASMILFPVTVIAAGILVGFIVLAWFLPLIHLLTELSR